MKTGSLQASEIQGRKNREEKTGKKKQGRKNRESSRENHGCFYSAILQDLIPDKRVSFPVKL